MDALWSVETLVRSERLDELTDIGRCLFLFASLISAIFYSFIYSTRFAFRDEILPCWLTFNLTKFGLSFTTISLTKVGANTRTPLALFTAFKLCLTRSSS